LIPLPLEQLIKELASLPGVGKRSAQRVALHMLQNPECMKALEGKMQAVAQEVKTCTICANIGLDDPCHICTSVTRDKTRICVVEGVDDLWAIERSGAFTGMYHVLGGVVDAMQGVGPNDLNMDNLVSRACSDSVDEVILALGASVAGQTTAHIIKGRLKDAGVNLTVLARGMPMGADVDYLDEGTISLALQGRQAV
jgi:recombination protein RecR